MNNDNRSNLSVFKTAMVVGGAYAAYNIGSGFATGAEVLQFSGSWGVSGGISAIVISFLVMTYYCFSVYHLGQTQHFETEHDIYTYYCGRLGGKFFDYFTLLTAFLYAISMFAGCGATIHQYFGVPTYVGGIVLAVASVVVASLGLKKIIDSIGWLGLVIIAFIIFLGLYSLFTAETGFFESQKNVLSYVENGKILQAGTFGIYNPVISALAYCGMDFMISLPLLAGMASRFKSSKQALGAGIASSALLNCGILLVLFAVLTNIDYIIEIGAQIPNLAVVQRLLPALQPVFALVIVLGIFTTVTAYLWMLAGRFFKEGTKPYFITIIAIAAVGVFGGSVLPFNALINIIYPYTGLVGLVLLCVAVFRDIWPRKGFNVEKSNSDKK